MKVHIETWKISCAEVRSMDPRKLAYQETTGTVNTSSQYACGYHHRSTVHVKFQVSGYDFTSES